MQIFHSSAPKVNEATLMYRNPLGEKGGRRMLTVGGVMFALVILLTVFGCIYVRTEGGVGLGVVLFIGAALYIAAGVLQIVGGVGLMKRPYAVIIDGDNLILREKHSYIHLPLEQMRRLNIDCHGIDAYLSVNSSGSYDVVIKGDVMYYTVDGVQTALSSRNMRKIAFILNGIALGTEKDVNWGKRYDELMQSEHVEKEGAVSGINKVLDTSAALAQVSADKPAPSALDAEKDNPAETEGEKD